MKKYLLLRDNRESGPHTIEDLLELKLVAKDLVWSEGESNCWLYPSEIVELKDFISVEKKKPPRIFVSKPKAAFQESSYPVAKESSSYRPDSFPEEQFEYDQATQKKGIWKSKKLPSMSNFLSVSALSCGLVLGAIMMKKAVDNSEIPVAQENVPLSVIREAETPPVAPIQNALLTEAMPAKPAAVKTNKPSKSKNIRDQISIKASDYSSGMLGGISNLQLKLFNRSSSRLDKVTLIIEYLKPNGSVIEKDQYEMYAIKPFSTSTLAIPDSKRGVKIKYRVVDISSKETREI